MSSTCENPPLPSASAPAQTSHLGLSRSSKLDRRAVTGALMLVMVLASMEQTVTSTAMPTIIGALHGLEHYSWVASIYLLACTVSMPLYGRLADAIGRKKVILFAIGVFLISSLLAGTAQTMPQLIGYRALMGIGAGGIMPVVLTIIGDIFTIEERARVQGFFSAVWGTASLAGPALGFFLVPVFGWRSIFFVNIPFGLLGGGVLMACYQDQEKPRPVDLDPVGFGSLTIGCAALLMLVSRLGPGGWPINTSLGLAATAAISLLVFIVHERAETNPILPLNLLVNRAIGPALIGSGLLGVGFLSLDTFVPLYMQGGRGGGIGSSALVVSPVILTWALSGIVAAPLLVRWGFRKTAWLGAGLIIVGFSAMLACALLGAPAWAMSAVLAITGFGFGPASMSYLLAAQNAVPWEQRGIITGSIQFSRSIGGAMGIGLLGALFNILTGPKLHHLQTGGITPAALLDPHLREKLPPEVFKSMGNTIAVGLHWVFILMLGVAALQAIVTCWMPSKKTDHKLTALETAEAMAG